MGHGLQRGCYLEEKFAQVYFPQHQIVKQKGEEDTWGCQELRTRQNSKDSVNLGLLRTEYWGLQTCSLSSE